MTAQIVEVTGAPGYINKFRAVLVPGLHRFSVSDTSPVVSVLVTPDGATHVIESRYVEIVEKGEPK